jgi:hypothetical protein
MAAKPLAIARNWAEDGRLARIPFGRPFVGAQRNRFRFDAGLAERIPERVDFVTARVGDRRPSWRSACARFSNLVCDWSFGALTSSTNSDLIPAG